MMAKAGLIYKDDSLFPRLSFRHGYSDESTGPGHPTGLLSKSTLA